MDYGKRLRLTFDGPVYHVTNAELTRWALQNYYGEKIYPTAIGYGESQNIVYLDFADFNNIVEPATLECLGCVAMGSPDLPLEPFSAVIYFLNLQPTAGHEYMALSSIDVEGVISVAFDGKVYADEYLRLETLSVEGEFLYVTFKERQVLEYLTLGAITVEGQYCDINGIPL